MRKEHKTRKEFRAERRSSQDPADEAANWRHGLRSVVRTHCATRRQWIDETDSRRKESTTVDIGDCQHADSNQRQLVADAVLGGRRHGQESSRGSGPTLIRGVVHVHDGRVSASDQPRDDDQRQQRDQSPCHPRPRHYSPSFVVDVEAESSASRAALASRPNTRRITASTRSNTRAETNATGTSTARTTTDCGTNGRPVTHSSTPSHHRANDSILAA
jgi:hypothetical protein